MNRTLSACVAMVCGCALVACLAIAQTAAAAPEVGRCVPVEAVKEGTKTVYNGGWKGKTCRKASPTHKGRYEWLPGAGESPEIEGISLNPVKFETTAGLKVNCLSGQSFGSITGATTEKNSLYINGCKDTVTNEPCQTETPVGEELPVEGTIRSQTLKGELGYTEGTKRIGWDLKPETGPIFATFECGVKPTGVEYVVEGSMIDTIKKGANKMTEEIIEQHAQRGGKPAIESFVGGEPDVLTASYLSGLEIVKAGIAYEDLEEEFTYEEMEYRTSTR